MSESKPKKRPGPEPATISGSTRLTYIRKFIPGKLHGRYAWLTILLCIVLALTLFWLFGREKGKNAVIKQNPQAVTTNQSLLPVQQAQVLGDKGDYAAAEQVWQQQLEQTTDTNAKLGVYYQMVQVAIKFKRYDDATGYAAKAMLLDSKSYIPYAAYASIAEAKGDKTATKKYLQDTIMNIDPNLNGSNLIKRDYQVQLDNLK